MNNISINPSTAENVLNVLEDIGFTIDSNNNAYWENDTNNKIHFKVRTSGQYTQIILQKSDNSTDIGTQVSFISTNASKITYEIIGNSIVLGFTLQTNTYQKIQWAIIEPATIEESWLYCIYSNTGLICDGSTENNLTYGTTSLFSGSAVQIAKFYDGLRFYNNLYITTVCTTIPSAKFDDTSGTNFLEATINNDTFLIINLNNSSNTAVNKIAIKKPNLN